MDAPKVSVAVAAVAHRSVTTDLVTTNLAVAAVPAAVGRDLATVSTTDLRPVATVSVVTVRPPVALVATVSPMTVRHRVVVLVIVLQKKRHSAHVQSAQPAIKIIVVVTLLSVVLPMPNHLIPKVLRLKPLRQILLAKSLCRVTRPSGQPSPRDKLRLH